MVAVLVVLTFVVLVALDYFVFSKRYPEGAARRQPAMPAVRPLSAASQPVPFGVFLQPTGTWSRLGESGDVYLGLHPLLAELVGTPLELELRDAGERVARGEPLLRIGRGGRHLTVRSPITGRVDEVNRQALGRESAGEGHGVEGYENALYRVRPERLADEVATWITGEAAAAWTRRRYADLRGYLQGAVADRHLGVVMADGGELPVGILREMDERVWAGLEKLLLAPDARPEDRP
jgi:hypothetical protein